MHAQFIRRVKSLWEKHGFFAVLGLCALAVGFTAYITRPDAPAPLPTIPPVAQTRTSQTTALPTAMPTLPPDVSVEAASSDIISGPAIAALPAQGEIICGFSLDKPVFNKTLGHYTVHPAIDIAANEGTAVHACADGIVTAAYADPMLGNIIEVDHGIFTGIYASLSTLAIVQVGDPVAAGQTLSFAGTCKGENHIGVHIHFAALKNGEYVDPASLMSE